MSEKEVFSIDLDNKDFLKKTKESVDALSKIGGQSDSLKGLISGFVKYGKVIGVATGAIVAMKVTMDSVFAGEKIKDANNQFKLLSDSIGIAGQELKDRFANASSGMLSAFDATELLNKSFIKLGNSIQRAPELLELSRKIGTISGQELTEVYENLSNALASGNTKSLKQYGIIVDSDKAIQRYARSIGVSVSALTQQGKTQALLNAALDTGSKRYSAITNDADKAKDAYKILTASLGNLKNAMLVIISKLGPALSFIFKEIAGRVDTLSNFLTKNFVGGVEASKLKIEDLTIKLNNLKLSLQNLEDTQAKSREKGGFYAWFFGEADEKRAERLKAKIEETRAQIAALQSEVAKETKPKIPEVDTKEDLIDRDAQIREEQKLQQDLLNIRMQSLEMRKQQSVSEQEIDKITAEQKTLLEQDFQLKKQMLEQEAMQKNIDNSAQIIALEEQKNLRLQELDNQLNEQRNMALDNYLARSQHTAQGVSRAFEVASKKAANDLKTGIGLGQKAVDAFSVNSTNALLAFGAGAQTAGQAFKGFLFGAIADTAQAFGQQMLLASVFPPNPIGLAAGAGLIALAGFLRSQAKGASDMSMGGGVGVGGAEGFGTRPETMSLEEKQQQKSVSINIQGSFYETEQTRTRLVEMIRESSDFTDFSLRPIGG